MAWDFPTDSEYQKLLDWADRFVREEVEPLDLVWPHQQYVPLNKTRRKAIDPLKEQVRRKGCGPPIWAPSLAVRATASSSSRC